jgi:hypothetical protein
LAFLLNFAVQRPLIKQQRLDLFLSRLQLTRNGADGARDVIFDLFQVGVAGQRALPREAELLLSAKQLVQRRAALRELAGDFANGANFAGCSDGMVCEKKKMRRGEEGGSKGGGAYTADTSICPATNNSSSSACCMLE